MKSYNFNYPMHNFRGIAIIFIVFTHCSGSLNFSDRIMYLSQEEREFYGRIFFSLFTSSTIFFCFIAGYLSRLLFKNLPWTVFIKKKIYSIIYPYLFMSTLIIIISFVKFKITGVHWHSAPIFDSPQSILHAYIFGEVQSQYWYIPFIFIVFLVTPFLIRLDKKILFNITLCSLIFPILYPRTYYPLECYSYILFFPYFFPTFLLGCLAEAYNDVFIDFIKKYINIIIIITIISFISFINQNIIYKGYYQDQISSYISKISLCMIIYYLLSKIPYYYYLIDIIAKNSFTIYFIHMIIIDSIFFRIFNPLIEHHKTFIDIFVSFFLCSFICFTLSLIISVILRKLFKSRARMFIG